MRWLQFLKKLHRNKGVSGWGFYLEDCNAKGKLLLEHYFILGLIRKDGPKVLALTLVDL